MGKNFDSSFATFFNGCKAIYVDHMTANFPTLPLEEFKVNKGRKYKKVILGHAVFCFVDITNGNVYKPSSFSSPAKGARGNVFDDSNGLHRISAYGPEYNR